MVSILYAHARSNYKKYPDLQVYDEARDALSFSGSDVIIAHPPCRLYSKMRAFSTAPEFEKIYAYHALKIIRLNGGILEHPCSSLFFKEANLPLPGSTDAFGGFTISVNQGWFGYYTEKRTRLYIVGCSIKDLPRLPFNFSPYTRKFDNLTRKQRSETVDNFIEWLLQVAYIINSKKNG